MDHEKASTEDIAARVRKMAEQCAASRGLEIFDVEYKAAGRLLRVFLDRRPGQVGLDDCAAVSEQLSAALDEQDIIPHSYRLEVSSPGLDRPLRGEDDYLRFREEHAALLLLQPVNGTASLRGRIGEVRSGMLRLEPDGQEPLWLPLSQIRSARLDPEPSRKGPGRSLPGKGPKKQR